MYKLFNRAPPAETPPPLPPKPKLLFGLHAAPAPAPAPPPPAPAPAPVKLEEEPSPVEQMILLPCPICFRTFKVESLERHKNVCQKVGTKKRKVFDSAKQRLEDLPDVPKVVSLSPQLKVPSSPLVRRKSLDAQSSSSSSKVPSWKEKHFSLIKTVREARGADSNRCPCCERNFGDKAFDRHVEWCREQQSRIPKSPTNSEAKERWEARTKYRAPLLRRSIRSKYSPTRSMFSASGSPAASVDRLTAPDCTTTQSLSGSRASLDSRASSTYSYQPQSTFSRASNYLNNLNNLNNNNNNAKNSLLYNSNTVGRASGSAFLRQAADRRSLRVAPPSPPPIRRVVDPPLAVTLTPLNNNRTSALRASLRMKNPFSTSSSGGSGSFGGTPVKPSMPSRQPTVVLSPTKSQQQQKQQQQPVVATTSKRPTVLQLFTSAFSRPSPVAPAKNRVQNSSAPPPTATTVTSTLSSVHLGQGRRSEPEGVESKLMTGSCYNYSTPTKIKSSRYGSDSYNPYLSAERQMAELFDDRPKETAVVLPNNKESESKIAKETDEEPASMEQLEQDLKSILSEISQLGQTSSKERETSWQQSKKSVASTPSSSTPTSSTVRLSMLSNKTTPAMTPEEQPNNKAPVPKFCHSCGSSYPDRHTVKFCCQCGARRLYI